MAAINIFELSKEFISIKNVYQLILQPFRKTSSDIINIKDDKYLNFAFSEI